MSDLSADRKKDIVVDLDWMTAAVLGVLFVFCALSAGGTAWRIFSGAPVKVEINWQTWFGMVMGTLLAVQSKERTVRIALVVFALSAASRILLRLIHASISIQIVNAEVMRVVGLPLMAGLCLYVVWYFKQRIRRA